MKKILPLLLSLVFILTACGKNYTFREDSFYTNISEKMDLVFPELTFSSPTELNADTRYLLFQLLMHMNELYHGGEDFKKQNHYEIPVSRIKSTLKTYLGSNQFNPEDLSDTSVYDKNKDCIILESLPVFGGKREVELTTKEYLGHNKVAFSTKVYDDNHDFLYTKVITMYHKPNENKYRLLSIDIEK